MSTEFVDNPRLSRYKTLSFAAPGPEDTPKALAAKGLLVKLTGMGGKVMGKVRENIPLLNGGRYLDPNMGS